MLVFLKILYLIFYFNLKKSKSNRKNVGIKSWATFHIWKVYICKMIWNKHKCVLKFNFFFVSMLHDAYTSIVREFLKFWKPHRVTCMQNLFSTPYTCEFTTSSLNPHASYMLISLLIINEFYSPPRQTHTFDAYICSTTTTAYMDMKFSIYARVLC